MNNQQNSKLNLHNTIASRIKQRLIDLDMQQKDIIDALGVPKSTVSEWVKKNEKRTPNTEYLIELAKCLNCSVDYLLGITKAPIPLINEDQQTLRISCDYTNLSELSINHIQSIQAMFDYEILNYLFECGAITDIVEVIYKALKYADTYNPSQFQGEIITRINNEVVDYFDLLMGNNKVQKELDLSEFNATRILQNAIEELYLNCGATDKSIQINKIIKETKSAGGLDD